MSIGGYIFVQTASGKQVRESAARRKFEHSVPRISMKANSTARRRIPPAAVCEPKRTVTIKKRKQTPKKAETAKSSRSCMCAGFEVVRSTTKNADTPCGVSAFFIGDPYGNRTHVTAVKGPCLNRLTNGPFNGSGCRI